MSRVGVCVYQRYREGLNTSLAQLANVHLHFGFVQRGLNLTPGAHPGADAPSQLQRCQRIRLDHDDPAS